LELHDGTTLRLFSLAINDLQDGNKSGCDIYYQLTDACKDRIDLVEKDFLFKTKQKGVLFLIGLYSLMPIELTQQRFWPV